MIELQMFNISSVTDFWLRFVVGLVMAGFFLAVSLELARKE